MFLRGSALEDRINRLPRNVGKKTNILRCVKSQKRADLNISVPKKGKCHVSNRILCSFQFWSHSDANLGDIPYRTALSIQNIRATAT